jgi:putative transposase
MKPKRINELYQVAFTELPIAGYRRHFVMAVLDCFSRYLLVLRVSSTVAVVDLIKGLEQSLEEARLVSDLPKDRTITLVTDTGPSLDTQAFSDYMIASPFHLAASHPHNFRSLGLVRRFLWALKDEEIGMNLYRDPDEAQHSLKLFRDTYNFARPHQALGYKVPAELFCKNLIDDAKL